MTYSVLSILPILMGVTLLITTIGFRRLAYFLSAGYALSVTALAIVMLVLLRANINFLTLLQCAILVFWGVRLGVFVTRRELKPGFKKERERIDRVYGAIKLPIKFAIWITVSVLYLLMVTPSLFSLESPSQPALLSSVFQGLGLFGMAGGLILEGIADQQKSAFKAKNPDTFCNTGLYSWVRCPNYLGEIIFWVGNWIMGIAFYKTPLEWVISLIGMICIVLIMFGSTRRLERTQNKRYGSGQEYQQFVRATPVLLPYIPLYSLQKIRILFG